uniref:CHK domain-containing protein n=1 Tax=Bursaphelenchus xylophilus TaxID=6326 RepID=A0A1I7SCT9_BURXY
MYLTPLQEELERFVNTKSVQLNKTFADSDFTNARLISLLSKHNKHFKKLRELADLDEINHKQIGVSAGFQSKIYSVDCHFSNGRTVSVIAKIPLINGLFDCCGLDNVDEDKENSSPDTKPYDQHSIECEFYEQFGYLRNVPLPEVYYTEKIDLKGGNSGLILMENMNLKSEPLGFYRSATENQCYEEFRCGLSPEGFFPCNAYLRTSLIFLLLDFKSIMDTAKIVQNKEYSLYAIRERPIEYGALTMAHGDTQPNNIMFKTKKDGSLTDELAGIIDWQLCFYASPGLDLARFLVLGADMNVREKCEQKYYDIYYNTLTNLYGKSCSKPPFTYEQGLEMFHLCLVQQSVQTMLFASMIDISHKQMGTTEPRFGILTHRIQQSIVNARGLIKKYNLEKFVEHSSWMEN